MTQIYTGKRAFSIILLILLCGIYTVYYFTVDWASYPELRVMGTFGFIQLLLSVWTSVRAGEKLISPYIMFLLVLYTFTFGQSLMYAFDIRYIKNDMVGFLGITEQDTFVAQYVTMLFLCAFQVGALLNKSGLAESRALSLHEEEYQQNRLKRIGWILAAVSVYPYYATLVEDLAISMTMGYGAIYIGEDKIGFNNWMSIVGDYFIPAMICLFIAYRRNRAIRYWILGVFILTALIIFVTGGRTNGVILFTLILILYNYLVKAFNKRDFVWIGAAGAMMLVVIANVGLNRGTTSRSVEETFGSSARTEYMDNPLVAAIGEMGNSMFVTVKTKNILDNTHQYRYGTSYLYAMTSVIPNAGFWEIHPAKKYANLGDWLTDELGLAWGTGYSMVAEAYANFRYFGAFMMILLGFLFSKLLSGLGLALRRRNLAIVAMILVFYWFSLKIPRNSFLGVVRAIFYYALPVCWYVRGYIWSIKKVNMKMSEI